MQVFSNEAKVTSGQTESGNVSACSLASVAPASEAMPPECVSNRLRLLQETASCGCELPLVSNIDVIKTRESNLIDKIIIYIDVNYYINYYIYINYYNYFKQQFINSKSSILFINYTNIII